MLLIMLLVLLEPCALQKDPPRLVKGGRAEVAPVAFKKALRYHGIVPETKVWCDQWGHWWFERRRVKCDLLKYKGRRRVKR